MPVTTSPRQKLLLIVFGLVIGAVGLAVVEGLLGLAGVGDTELFDDPYVGFAGSSDLFEERQLADGRRFYSTRPSKLKFFNPQEFAVDKAPDGLRVFTLGGSTTAGRPYDDRVSFGRWLERYLDAAEPGRAHEVVNAGGVSYASYRVVRLMEELVRYSPDLFVVYTGHNEFLEERTYGELRRRDGALHRLGGRLAHWVLSHWRLAGLVRGALAEPRIPATRLEDDFKTRLDVWTGLDGFRRDPELEARVVEHFAFNLERMVAIARAHEVELMFVRPVSNLKDFSPFKSEHRAGLALADRRRFEAGLREGRDRLEAGDAEGALEALGRALEIDGTYAELHFRLGRAHLSRGDLEAAQAAFVRAKDLDVAPLRALESVVEQIDALAERHGLPVIDPQAWVVAQSQARSGVPIPGDELLLDHVHPDAVVHSWIAERVLATLADAGEVEIDQAWSETRQNQIFEREMAALDRRYYAERDLNLAKVLGWAGKLEEAEGPLLRAAEILDGNGDLHLNLGTLFQKTGRLPEAARELERAVQLTPSSPEAHFNLGVVYGRLERLDDGLVALNQAAALRPDYAEAHHNLGVLYRQAGQAERAIDAGLRALELRPEAAELHRSLGLAYRSAGRLTPALEAFEESLRLDPEPAGLRVDLGVTLAMAERLDEAQAELERAAALDPTDAEAPYNLGLLAARRGQASAAADAYGRALELQPDHALAHNNLGILRAGQGDLAAAERHLLRATRIDPGSAEAFLNLGVVYDQAGHPGPAIQAIERSLELATDQPRAHLALALLYHAQGRTAEALPHFELARRQGLRLPPEIAELLPP